MANLSVFNFESQEIRFVGTSDEPWWVAMDLCSALAITNASDATEKLDDDEKLLSVLTISGQKREVLCVNESGLYSLVLTSRKPQAKRFKKWLTSEVIPSIRKTGSYNAAPQLSSVTSAKISQLTARKASVNEEIRQLENALTNKKRELRDASEALVVEAKAFYDSDPDAFKTTIACKEILDHARQGNPYLSLPPATK